MLYKLEEFENSQLFILVWTENRAFRKWWLDDDGENLTLPLKGVFKHFFHKWFQVAFSHFSGVVWTCR